MVNITKHNKFLGPIASWSIHVPGVPKTQHEKIYKRIFTSRVSNYRFTFLNSFVAWMAKKINKYHVFRIHVNGYFYSQTYLEKWFEIVKRCPHTTFWVYIGPRDIELDYRSRPTNFKAIAVHYKQIRANVVSFDNIVSTQFGEFKCPQPKIRCIHCLRCIDTRMKIKCPFQYIQ